MDEKLYYGKHLKSGDDHWRAFVGPPQRYDLMGAMQFNLLTYLGLREHHALLDIGCGSLRAGRLFITYLLPNRYHGVEPHEDLVFDGVNKEIGVDMTVLKNPEFRYNADFDFLEFGHKFDFVLAQSIFTHTSLRQMKLCMKNAREVMNDDAIFAATYKIGSEDYTGDEWHYPKTIRWTEKTFIRAVEEAGLQHTCLDWPHPHGQVWSALTTEKRQMNWISLTLPEREVVELPPRVYSDQIIYTAI